jgi:hypothetical protein
MHALMFVGASAVTTFTTLAVATSRYHDILSTAPLLFSHPSAAIFILQSLITLSAILVWDCFRMTCERVRWALVECKGGIHFLSFVVLSDPAGFGLTLRLLISKPSWRFWRPEKWRWVALTRFIVPYVALTSAHAVWSLCIVPQPSYEPQKSTGD